MIRKISLRNIMAHEQTDIALGQGLNVLVGPNNIGKSTIAYAVKLVARNSNSAFILRHDAKECSVTIETAENHVIQWSKKKSPSYLINGVVKDRLGRGGVPKELETTLRLAPVAFEDTEFEPHFGEQKSPIFLINRSPGQVAQFFSTTSDAERLVAMQKLHQRKRTDAALKSKYLEGQKDELVQSIQALADVPSLAENVSKLEKTLESINSVESQIEQLNDFLGRWSQLWISEQKERITIQSLSRLTAPPQFFPTEPLATHIQHRAEVVHASHWTAEISRCLANLLSTPDLHPITPISELTGELCKLELTCSHTSVILTELSNLNSPPSLHPTDALWATVSDLGHCETEIRRLAAQSECCQSLRSIPAWESTEEISDWLLRTERAAARFSAERERLEILANFSHPPVENDVESIEVLIETIQSKLEVDAILQQNQVDIDRELHRLETALEEMLIRQPVCPICGTLLTAEMVRLNRGSPHKQKKSK